MIKNTEAFYTRAREYQDKRAELTEAHEKRLKAIEKYKGSQGYQTDKKKEDDSFKADLTALQNEYRSSLNTILDGMEKNISKRGVTPPTNDMLNLIHMVKMRKSVSESELDRVAQMMDGNAMALGVLQEVARDNNIHKNYLSMAHEMPTQTASDELRNLRSNTEDFIQSDLSYANRVWNKLYTEKYGGDPVYIKRKTFDSPEGCWRELSGLHDEGLKQFSAVVDGSGSDDQ